ncbi:MAG: amino acid adenylation domain-containing protein [Bacteroidetes bacterium]|nr:amino acid adenylation domain-containing protein [Bacteroidota bacterium]
MKKTEPVTLFPLSHPQERIWYTEMMHLNTAFANLPFKVVYPGELDLDILAESINHVIRLNDGLRIRLHATEENGLIETRQYVADFRKREIDHFDFSGPGGNVRLNNWLISQSREPFVLHDQDLFYFAVVRFSDSEWGCFFKIHHLIADGWTIDLVVKSIEENYRKRLKGEKLPLEKKPSCLDYLSYEEAYLSSSECEKDRKFWHETLLPLPDEIVLPFKKNKTDSIRANTVKLAFSPKIRARMHEFCQSNHTSVFKLILSALAVYINRITALDDVVFATVNHGRETDEQKLMTGMFVSTFPVRIRLEKDVTFASLVLLAGDELNKVIRNYSRYPLDRLIMELREKTGQDPSWLLNILLVGHPNLTDDAVKLDYLFPGYEPSPLTIHINPSGKDAGGILELQFDYHSDLFEEENIQQVFAALSAILDHALSDPLQQIDQIELVSQEEKERLLVHFNATDHPFPKPRFVKELFEEQAARTPAKTAVVYLGKTLTYDELNRKSNRLAHKLKSLGARPGAVIGILADRSPEMIIGVMAALKSGCAYVPIDAAYPGERIQYMLGDSRAFALLSHRHLQEKSGFTGLVIGLDDPENYHGDDTNPETINQPDDLVYIIYTSGSTGKPKGVMVAQWPLAHFILWHQALHQLTEADNTTKFASFGFDVTVWEIFPTLISGATLHIIADEIRLSPIQLNEYFEANNITVSFLPTQFGEQFIDNIENHSLRWLDVAGEKLRSFRKRPYTLMNGYGPTEYADCTTWFIVDKYYDNIPIGKPIWNTRIYILDKYNKLRPVGIPGELCVAGTGLAEGYFGKPELTAEKFVDDPFYPGHKMYRTGDLCRWLQDGNIEYLGRIDFQVKIRGFRVEPGEIEQAIKKQPMITDAVVIDRTDTSGRTFLSGYYVADAPVDPAKIKEKLGIDLPEYMIPPFLVQIEKMPLTPNGKIDRKALPEPERLPEETRAFIAPVTETEKSLAGMWKQILGIDAVSMNDDFFLLGGHSLKAALLQARIQKEFQIQLSLQNIFHNPVLHDLSLLIDKSAKQDYVKITHVANRPHYPVASAQKRLFIVNQMENIGITYNIPLVFLIEGNLDTNALSKAIEDLASRHEVFRTSFDIVDGVPVQIVNPKVRIKRFYQEAPEEDAGKVIREFIRPFDLRTAPLFRAGLVKFGEHRHLLIFDVHHIVFDGWSVDIFLEELWGLYKGKKLPPLKLQYRDYAVWQQNLGAGELMKKQEQYWIRQFEGELPSLNLETDFPRGSSMTFDGARLAIELDRDLTDALKNLVREEGATLFMVLLSAYSILLSKYTNQEEIVVGIPSSGRSIPELEKMIGMFVNTLPVRSKPSGESTFRTFLSGMKSLVLDAYDNQDYQLDSLVEKLGITRNSGRNPLFDVMFAFRSQPGDIVLKEITVKPFEFTFNITKFDLTIEVIEKSDTMKLEVEYRKHLFNPLTIENLGSHYVNLLREIATGAGKQIKEFNILNPEEKEFLLKGYNNTRADYPREKTIFELFEEQVAADPGKTAVIHDRRTVSYSELNENANGFARLLREKGIQPDQVIGVMMEQGIEFITVILGIIKAGGAYLPIDPEYPEERIGYILENSHAPILITTPEARPKAILFQGEIMEMKTGHRFEGGTGNLPKVNKPDDLVYIIYTSGSTGKPKGVMITHSGLVNYITWARKVYLEGESVNFPLYSSISFDLTVTSIFTPLASGNAIVVYAGGDKSTLIKRLVEDNKAGILKLTPTHLGMLENIDCSHSAIKRFIVGGEELRTSVAGKIYSKFGNNVKIFNEYGPTETVVGCMIHLFNPEKDTRAAVPIGIPGDNVRIYLLDKYLMPVPAGVSGEMYISGDGVARGYLNRPDITAERFLHDPFYPGQRMYKTGDLAKFLPEGEIEFLGRVDFQVKIRGFRIELGEIESKLMQHPALKDALVLPQQDENGINLLCAYYVSDNKIPVNELKTFLAGYLPDYMIPSYFIPLEVIPLTPNGKVDRNKLPKSGESVYTGIEYVEPRTETEQIVRDTFAAILQVTKVGINDNFFDLGGNSLRAVALVAELQKYFEVTMNDVFRYQTVALLAKNVRPGKNRILTRLREIRETIPAGISSLSESMRDRKIRKCLSDYAKEYKKYQAIDLSKKRDYRHILLTGATGFLGAYLLRDLLTLPGSEIYLPVRAGSEEEAAERIREKTGFYFGEQFYPLFRERIHVVRGDLSSEMLGFPKEVYDDLAGKIDCIIHSAALVKHYGQSEEFFNSNVKPVENLIAFAGTGRKKDFHHISTLSVGMGNIPGKQINLYTEYDLDSGQKSDLHYLVTKLEAEKKLNAARAGGLMANIYRIGNITFDSKTGRSQENLGDNAFFHVVRSFVNLGFIPDKLDEVEFSFVDQVSRAILHLFNRESLQNETFHIKNSQIVKQSEILTAPELDLRIRKIRFTQFIDQLIENYTVEEFRPSIEAILLHYGWLEEEPSGGETTLFKPLSNKTDYILKKTGFRWPRLKVQQMNSLIIEALKDRIGQFREITLFNTLGIPDVERLAKLAIQQHYPSDSEILWEGEPNPYFFIITRGTVEISRHSKSGWLGTVMVAGKGDFLGSDQLFQEKHSSNNAEAILGDVHVYAFRTEDFKQLVIESPALSASLIRILAERVSRLTDLFVNMS